MIPKATRILSEEVILTLSKRAPSYREAMTIRQAVEAMMEDQRQVFLSMHNIHPYKNITDQYHGIFRTNALSVDGSGAIFLEACRINHACDNNAQNNWNQRIKRHTVHASREINKGEKITITYINPLQNRESRQKDFEERFSFTCSCRLCSLPSGQSQESDKKLEEICSLDGVIEQLGIVTGILKFPLQPLRYLDQQVRLYNAQGKDTGFAQAFVDAADVSIANSDLARRSIFAQTAASVWKTTFGNDSAEAIKNRAIAHSPSSYQHFGMSKKWNSQVDDVSQGLGSSDFEDWLWRRGNHKPWDN